MELNTLSPAPGSRKAKKRVGRGIGSGSGKTSGSVTKVRSLVLAAQFVRDSKAVRCPYKCAYLSMALAHA